MQATFAIETRNALWEEIKPLLAQHWAEIAHDKTMALQPHAEAYARLDAAGSLRCYTARVDGKLVGYFVAIVGPALHYAHLKQATEDIVYVDPEHRRNGTGIGLLRFAESSLAQEGVDIVQHHVKVAHPTLGKILAKMGYEPVDVLYMKRIPHGIHHS